MGYGFTGARRHTPAYLQRRDVEIVAVVDRCPARRSVVPKVLPTARIFESVQALFTSGINLDFVDVATSPNNHFAIAHEAMKRGVHVLCETPLTMDVASAEALVECAAASKRVLFPSHNRSFAPTVRAISDVISSGRIGRIRSVKLETFRPTPAHGVLEWNPDPKSDFRKRRDGPLSGIAVDDGCHTFHLAFAWLNAWLTALSAKMMHAGDDRWETEDCSSATLRFPGGRMAYVHMSWTAGRAAVIYTVHGERGTITARDDHLEVVTAGKESTGYWTLGATREQGESARSADRLTASADCLDASHTQWFSPMFDRFVSAIEHHEYVGRAVRDACRCVAIIEAADTSAADAGVEVPPSKSRFGHRDTRPDRRATRPAREHSAVTRVTSRAGLAGPGTRRRG